MLQRLRLAEEDQAHRRRHGERDDHRGERAPARTTVASGRKNDARQALEHEDRRDRDDLDQRRVDDRAADLERRVEDDPARSTCCRPSARCCRSRRTTFSMSMMASSTMSPRAITKPGEDHRVDRGARADAARARRRSSDSGIATTLITAVRHSYRKAHEHQDHQDRADQDRRRSRLSIESSMKVAGRKIVGVDRRCRGGPASAPRAPPRPRA